MANLVTYILIVINLFAIAALAFPANLSRAPTGSEETHQPEVSKIPPDNQGGGFESAKYCFAEICAKLNELIKRPSIEFLEHVRETWKDFFHINHEVKPCPPRPPSSIEAKQKPINYRKAAFPW